MIERKEYIELLEKWKDKKVIKVVTWDIFWKTLFTWNWLVEVERYM